MTNPILTSLVSPQSTEDFLKTFWRKKVCHFPGDANRFNTLFNWTTLTDLFNYNRLDPAHVQCCINGDIIPPHELIKDLPQFLKGLDSSIIQAYINEGATLILARIHEVNEAMQSLCYGLSYEVGDEVIANLYCSWPGVQEYDIHADDHGLFVLQLEGKKEWHIFKPFSPHEHIDDVSSYLDEVVTLSKGDVLYIPRGVHHCAYALEPSMHATVGIYPRTLSDFVDWVVKEVTEDPIFGNEIPMGIQKDPFNYGYQSKNSRFSLDVVKDRFLKVFDDPDMIDRFNRFCIGHEDSIQSFQFPFYGTQQMPITKRTKFQRKSFQKFSFKETPTEISIYVWGKKLTYASEMGLALRKIFGSTTFSAKEILSVSESYTWPNILKLLEGLVRWGIIRIS